MGSTTDADGPETCVVCGESVEDAVNRRVVSRIEDQQAVHFQFCSNECLETWQDR